MRELSAGFVALVAAPFVFSAGCQEAPAPRAASPPIIRDSAGITIVEGGTAAFERAQQYLEDMPFPGQFPPYSRILVDAEGNLWVEGYRWPAPWAVPPDPPDTHWSVFDADGVWLGRVTVPGRFLVHDIGTDYVLGTWKDHDDVAHIREYALVKPAPG